MKIRGTDGRWFSETFDTMTAAREREAKLVGEKFRGATLENYANKQMSLSEFFDHWDEATRKSGVSSGWRKCQIQMFRDHVEPVLGNHKLQKVVPAAVLQVLKAAGEKGFAPQTQVHLYNVMHKLFEDAIHLFQVLEKNPVLKSLKPELPTKEAAYLEVAEVIKLLQHVRGKPYEVAVWLGVYAGRRVGEIQSLRWNNVDLGAGLIHIRSNYIRREKRFQDYPKGKKWHSIKMPQELWDLLKAEALKKQSEFVAVPPRADFLDYGGYYKALRRYCRECGIKVVATHGLRHSASELWMSHGASRDDLRILFAHSSSDVTDRYVHDKGQRLSRVADVIRLFPEAKEASGEGLGLTGNRDVPQMFPKIVQK
ncbi:MAG: hypothetical protein A2Z97_08430 [Bdellovibrionales bacterium GWB1_52_6]|nr:MAG: hypothetical protein A2Z97_08430 [Bdellovibrionales bacterium GWB1_52_6]